MFTAVQVDRLAGADQCAQVAVLALRVLADLRRWANERLPRPDTLPLEALALAVASASPWRGPQTLFLPARMSAWAYAIDDHVERDVTDCDELDELLDRCEAVVSSGSPDTGQPLLAALSDCQARLESQPSYPVMVELWVDRFGRDMRGIRYDWTVGRAREEGTADVSSAAEYLRHADSILVWTPYLPRWIQEGDPSITDHLSVLASALDEKVVAVRLANDLASISRESSQRGQNNILMYGVSREWVLAELTTRIRGAHRQLAPLVGERYLPAVELLRSIDWAVHFYQLADLRMSDSQASLSGRTEWTDAHI